MPNRPANSETPYHRLCVAAEERNRTPGQLLAVLLRRYGHAETARRIGINRSNIPWLCHKAGVRIVPIAIPPGYDAHIVREVTE